MLLNTKQKPKMETENKKMIVNGSLNKTITEYEFLNNFSLEEQKQGLWYKSVGVGCFIPYVKIQEINTKEGIMNAFDKLEYQEEIRKREESQKEYFQGQKIRQAQKELSFGGSLRLSYYQILGYVSQIGNWNDFDIYKVIPLIDRIQKEVPKMDYGVNNPNTGNDLHQWETVGGAYINVCFDSINEKDKERVVRYFNDHDFKFSSRASSARIEVNNLPNNRYEVKYIFWWD